MTLKDKRRKTKDESSSGITLLLVIVILSALLSIGIGIFNVVIGQIKISGDLNDSFIAFYAADQALERVLFIDRNLSGCGVTSNPPCTTDPNNPTDIASGGCYTVRTAKTSTDTTITAFGQYRCGANPSRVVKRGFLLTYANTGGTPSPSPISQWKMDETSGSTVADSVGTNNGTANGTTIVSGFTGAASDQARSFSSGNYVRLDTLTTPPAPLTLSAWVYPTERVDGQYIFGRLNPGSYANGALYIYDSTLSQIGWACDNNAGNRSFFGSTNTKLQLNQWSFVAVTTPACNSPSTGRVYVNGQDVTTPSAVWLVGSPSYESVPSFIGAQSNAFAGSTYFRGKIDEMNLYNTALTTTQICSLYKAQGGTGNCP